MGRPQRHVPRGGEAGRAGAPPQPIGPFAAHPDQLRRLGDAAFLRQKADEAGLPLRRPAIGAALHRHRMEGRDAPALDGREGRHAPAN